MLDLLIDLDNTIYSESEKIFSQVDSRMKEFISKKLEVDSKKAYLELGWEPKTTLEEMIESMIINDSNEANKELILRNKGFSPNNSLETIPKIMGD